MQAWGSEGAAPAGKAVHTALIDDRDGCVALEERVVATPDVNDVLRPCAAEGQHLLTIADDLKQGQDRPEGILSKGIEKARVACSRNINEARHVLD